MIKNKSKSKSAPARAPRRAKVALKAVRKTEPKEMYSLRLYITGQTPRSAESVQNLKQVCEQYLAGRFELEVIDIYQQPELAQKAQIIAAPTLIKRLPLPLRRLVGDLSNRRRVLLGLDLENSADLDERENRGSEERENA
jgi:circadian clock protein KaiB